MDDPAEDPGVGAAPEGAEDSPPQESKGETVPIGRFNEVYKETKELKEEVAALKGKAEPGTQTPEAQKEADAEKYLDNLLDKRLDARETAAKEATAKEDTELKESIDNTLSINTDVKREEFLKFMEEKRDTYKFQSVEGAMSIYRDMNNLTKEVQEKTKEDMGDKPSFPKTEGAPSGGETIDDSGKTLQQIANEAVSAKKD